MLLILQTRIWSAYVIKCTHPAVYLQKDIMRAGARLHNHPREKFTALFVDSAQCNFYQTLSYSGRVYTVYTIFLFCFNYCQRFLCYLFCGRRSGARRSGIALFYMQCERDCGFNSGRDPHWPDLSMKIKARLIVIYVAESLPRHLSPTVNKLNVSGKL